MRKETLERYDALVALCPRFERKGKTMPYTSANGHMFSLLNKDGELGIRFSEDVKSEHAKEFKTTEFRSHGAVMQGYVLIPADLLDDAERMIDLLNESYDFVMSLDPK